MNKRPVKNVSASVRQRLLNLARARGEDFQHVLVRYAIERLLYRISRSSQGHRFVLKGAVLFSLWSDSPHRATRDLDLWSHGDNSVRSLEESFQEICTTSVDDDGIVFNPGSVAGSEIRRDDEYLGVRLRFLATLAGARVPMQVDVGFGDDVTPPPQAVRFPTLLPFAEPEVRAYPREAVVAEKFQAMVTLGMGNSRMKDFYDLFVLARDFDFTDSALCRAIRSTFGRRDTPIPKGTPLALTEEFYGDRAKLAQWRAFLRKSRVADADLALSLAVRLIRELILPPTNALANDQIFSSRRWRPGGPWA